MSVQDFLITIIVPVYNVERYLDKCIWSLCNQTYKNIEIILSDDGSTDGSGKICDDWARKDNRIKCIHSATNNGRIKVRELASSMATGDYITNVDGDDWIEADRIENIVKNGLNSDVDIVFLSGWIKEYPNRQELGEVSNISGTFNSSEVYEMLANTECCFERQINPSLCCQVIHRELFVDVIKKIDNRIQMGDDVTFTWMVLHEANTVKIIEDNRYHYVQRPESINHTLTYEDIPLIKLSFDQIKSYLMNNNASVCMYRGLAFTYSRLLASVGDKSFFCCEREFLFPYQTVITGSRVVVYGAGDMGRKLVSFLVESDDYICSGWIDKYNYGRKYGEIASEGLETLLNIQYDFIAIAIVSASIANEVVKDLLHLGIPKNKIATMSPEAINIERTEKCLLG